MKFRLTISMLLLGVAALRAGGQSTRDPLTDKQVEEVRDTGADPLQRIKLYMRFIEERTTEIHRIASDPREQSVKVRSHDMELHNLMEEYTRLADELQDNMDTYSGEHSDLRKALKELVDHSQKWETVLNEPKASEDYDFARKTAIDTTESTTELAKSLLAEQEQYFARHKAEKRTQKPE